MHSATSVSRLLALLVAAALVPAALAQEKTEGKVVGTQLTHCDMNVKIGGCAGTLTMDIYYPPEAKAGSRTPAVIFVIGFSDIGARRMLGCAMKDMGAYVSWAQLAAASGLVAITYTNSEPAADLDALLQHVRQNAASLGIDENRIGVFACSGNVPLD